MPLLLNCIVVPAGTGVVAIGAGRCGDVYLSTEPTILHATPSGGSTFAGWSCVGTGGGGWAGYSITVNNTTNFLMPNETVTCTATFNSTAVSAPVDSPLALSLVFLGIAAVAGFQRWRKRV